MVCGKLVTQYYLDLSSVYPLIGGKLIVPGTEVHGMGKLFVAAGRLRMYINILFEQ